MSLPISTDQTASPSTPSRAEPGHTGGKAKTASESTNYWDWCPRCSNRLESHRCKYVCRRCGYYMSCSDFD